MPQLTSLRNKGFSQLFSDIIRFLFSFFMYSGAILKIQATVMTAYVSCRMHPIKYSVSGLASIMESLLPKEDFLTPGLFLLGHSPDLPITYISVDPK